jgi:hypothetical protein
MQACITDLYDIVASEIGTDFIWFCGTKQDTYIYAMIKEWSCVTDNGWGKEGQR